MGWIERFTYLDGQGQNDMIWGMAWSFIIGCCIAFGMVIWATPDYTQHVLEKCPVQEIYPCYDDSGYFELDFEEVK